MLARIALITAKTESSSGSDAVPKPELNAILVRNLQITFDGRPIERQFLRASLDRLPHSMGRALFSLSFETELKGSPALGVRPEVGPLWRSAGFQETVAGTVTSIRTAAFEWVAGAGGTNEFYCQAAGGGTPALANPSTVYENNEDMKRGTVGSLRAGQFAYGDNDTLGFSTVYVRLTDGADPDSKALDYVKHVAGTSVTYTQRNSGFETSTIYIYLDGVRCKFIGSVSDWSATFNAGEFPTCRWNVRSLYTRPDDLTIPTTENFQANLPPICESMALTIGSYVGVIQNLTINGGVQIAEREDINSALGFKGLLYTGRNVTGSVNPEAVIEATHTYWARMDASTEMTLAGGVGTTPSKITLAGPNVQYGNIQTADRAGNLIYQVPIFFNENAATGAKCLTMTYN